MHLFSVIVGPTSRQENRKKCDERENPSHDLFIFTFSCALLWFQSREEKKIFFRDWVISGFHFPAVINFPDQKKKKKISPFQFSRTFFSKIEIFTKNS